MSRATLAQPKTGIEAVDNILLAWWRVLAPWSKTIPQAGIPAAVVLTATNGVGGSVPGAISGQVVDATGTALAGTFAVALLAQSTTAGQGTMAAQGNTEARIGNGTVALVCLSSNSGAFSASVTDSTTGDLVRILAFVDGCTAGVAIVRF